MASLLQHATPLPRQGHFAFSLGKTVLLWRGKSPSQPGLPTVTQSLQIESGRWQTVESTVRSPGEVAACVQVGGVVYCLVQKVSHSGHSAHTTLLLYKSVTDERKMLEWEIVQPAKNQLVVPCVDSPPHYLVTKGHTSLVLFTPHTAANSLNVFNLSEREWSSPEISGHPQPQPSLSGATLTTVDERRAVLFGGGYLGGAGCVVETNGTYLLDMEEWVWSEVAFDSLLRPPPRSHHSACLITLPSSPPALLVIGGLKPAGDPTEDLTYSDAWVLDLQSQQWEKVDLPAPIAARCEHTATSINVGGVTEHVMIYGGIGASGTILAEPALLEVARATGVQSLYELCHQYLVSRYQNYTSTSLDLLPTLISESIAAQHQRMLNLQQLGITVATIGAI